jgi:O-methyltransferase
MNVDEMLEKVASLGEGDYAEVGVWKGSGARRIAQAMNQKSRLWLFDPLTGHEEPGKYDLAEYHPRGRYNDTSVDVIFEGMPKDREVRLIVGYVPESLYEVTNGRFRFARIDVDHYLPTKGALEFFKPRMVNGGIMEFDDWTCAECPGAARAIQEVFGEPIPFWVNA